VYPTEDAAGQELDEDALDEGWGWDGDREITNDLSTNLPDLGRLDSEETTVDEPETAGRLVLPPSRSGRQRWSTQDSSQHHYH